MHEFIVWLITFCHILAELSTANGISLFANTSDKNGNGIQLPTAGHQNESKLLNITGNKLNPETTTISTTVYKIPTRNHTPTHSISRLLEGSEGGKANTSKNATTLPTSLSTMESTTKLPTTHLGNYTTTSPPHGFPRHHFNMKLLDYIIIPIGCVLAIVISYFLVRHVQKVRRKRRLERELFHQYSYPNSEADDMEEQNIGEIESVINAQFVSFNDRSDKNLYEDSSVVNLAFDETSKLVVQDPPPASPDELEASTSFNT